MKNNVILTAAATLILAASTQSAEYVWTGAGNDGNWATAANWKPGTGFPRSGDDAVFPEASSNNTVMLNGDQAVHSITFNPVNLFSYFIKGNSLTLDDGGQVRFLKMKGDVGMHQSAVQVISSDIKLAGRVTFGNENRWYLGGEQMSIQGRISGSHEITIDSERGGPVGFAGDNSGFVGPITIKKGMLYATHRAALGTGTQPVRMEGGNFWVGATPTSRDFLIASNAAWSACMSPAGPHTGTITVNKGATWSYATGGNSSSVQGVIAGEGDVTWNGGMGTTLGGTAPNTLSGSFSIAHGNSTLAKPAGINAIAGPLVIHGGAKLRLGADEQISDKSTLKFFEDLGVLDLNGHHETLGSLDLQGHAFIDCADGSNTLAMADSSAVAWNTKKELIVRNWKGNKKGGGPDRLVFGNNREALTAGQLACIGFRNPAGFADGLYTASILKTGEIVPSKPVQPVNPPYDVSDSARAERQKIYEVPGRANLSGKGTPLKKDMKISFYGDSITWGGGYIGVIGQALKAGEGSKDLNIKLINHGVNGGGALTLRDGEDSKSHAGGTKPRPLSETVPEDKPDVVVIYIGINDIWWRKTSPVDFEKALSDLVASVKGNKAAPVLATLSVWGDSPLKENKNNEKCDEYADITRKVAAATGATLVDLRKAFTACLMNNNPELRLDGSMRFFNNGILTGDGVHANGKGNELLADMISQGIFKSLSK